ncbi:MAG: starch-binding protein [Lachnospiraceae bacterium]|nr:starch-binding protein [Lachnospiraceae bacterium]
MSEVKGDSKIAKKESRAGIIGSISCAALIIGANLPLYIARVLAANSGKSRVNKEGFIIVIAAIFAAVMIYIRKQRYVIAAAIASMGVLVHYFVFVPTLSDYYSISYGYYVQWAGAIGLLLSAFLLPGKNDAGMVFSANEAVVNYRPRVSDLKWIATFVVISLGLVFLFDKGILLGEENKPTYSQAMNESGNDSSENDYEEEPIDIEDSDYDFIGEECNVNINNVYIVDFDSRKIAVAEFIFKNKMDYDLKFGDSIIVDVTQQGQYLKSVTDIQGDWFDLSTNQISVAKDEEIRVYTAYELMNDMDYINLGIKMANEPTITVATKDMGFDTAHYNNNGDVVVVADNGDNNDDDSSVKEEEKKNEKPKTTKEPKTTEKATTTPVKTEVPAKTTEPVKTETPAKTSTPVKTETPAKTAAPTAAPTVTPTKAPSKFRIYFNRPDGWESEVYVYVFNMEDGTEMCGWNDHLSSNTMSYSSGKYTIEIDNKWLGCYVVFHDGKNNQYPAYDQNGDSINKLTSGGVYPK